MRKNSETRRNKRMCFLVYMSLLYVLIMIFFNSKKKNKTHADSQKSQIMPKLGNKI